MTDWVCRAPPEDGIGCSVLKQSTTVDMGRTCELLLLPLPLLVLLRGVASLPEPIRTSKGIVSR